MKKALLICGLVLGLMASFSVFGEPIRISILGDSYSTFKDCIPKGNACWYPRLHRNDVKKAEECSPAGLSGKSFLPHPMQD